MPTAPSVRETRPPEPEPPTPPTGGRGSRRTLVTVAVVIVVLAAVGVALGLTLGGGSTKPKTAQAQSNPFTPPSNGSGGGSIFPQPQTTTTPQATTPQGTTTPQTQTTPATVVPQQQSQAPIGPSYDWLGAQVSATPSGVVVATVTIGGAADKAGLNPGDVISEVNHTAIGSISQLQSATSKLSIGSTFQMIVDRGSTAVTITATLNDRPVRQP